MWVQYAAMGCSTKAGKLVLVISVVVVVVVACCCFRLFTVRSGRVFCRVAVLFFVNDMS